MNTALNVATSEPVTAVLNVHNLGAATNRSMYFRVRAFRD